MLEPASAAMRRAITQLKAAGVENAVLDARLLMQHAARWSATEYVENANRPLSSIIRDEFEAMVLRRIHREPVAQITGSRSFWRDEFAVTRDVLCPRPDSETLIEAMLELRPDQSRAYRILDLGTGSGCLLLSLLREYPQASGVGVDASEAALAIARKNANTLNLNDRSDFLQANWGETLTERYDMVITNPPYIGEQDIAQLAPEVRDYEPIEALCGGTDGLAAYRTVMPHIARCLAPDGVAVIELGARQGEAVSTIAYNSGLEVCKIQADLAGIARALCINHRA